ncbi:hypothetical protein SCLCIDRAFT_118810 [Scleroderma citrinum Foug A]|uniref:Uncharacterized protein n=1 Tax=Scleroderma citrinum Foug A TaxID=1036808 RepID=A0A0C2ZMA2_9AGAM|nr:hypothetical protein SCLCIDRAFT_118810 [Scleroderma citrinum Foug A]
MYSNNYASQRSNPVELSNNPFLSDPSNPYTRFPDISVSSSSQSPPQFPSGYGTGYGDQAQYPAQALQYQQQYLGGYSGPPQVQHQSQFVSTSHTPQYSSFSQPSQLMSQPTGFGFQPTNAFGQQLQQYALQSGHPSGQQYAGEGYPQQSNPGYLSEFDPYAQRPTSPSYSQVQGATASGGTYAKQHPRDVLRSNKAEIERWNQYSWKQLINACDALRDAWTTRKQHAERTLRQYGGDRTPFIFGQGHNDQLLEGWRQAMNVAESNSDTITACTFQLQEVFTNYRQSGDPGSKRRVREACNAAITGLPDWPSPLS